MIRRGRALRVFEMYICSSRRQAKNFRIELCVCPALYIYNYINEINTPNGQKSPRLATS